MPSLPPDVPCLLRIELGVAATSSPLMTISFDGANPPVTGGLCISVPLRALDRMPLREHWSVDGDVRHGHSGNVRWARGGGWLVAALELDESVHGGIEATAAEAYATLAAFAARQPERHVLRIWNYLADINAGLDDNERYKLFCAGRRRGLGEAFQGAYPAATAIGHRDRTRGLIVYWLASVAPGTRIENPRQVPAWRYPRQYGPVPPGFARGTRLPDGSLAISGTASIVGHASLHVGDCAAQVRESLANIAALQVAAGLPPEPEVRAPMKIYLRDAGELPTLRANIPAGIPVQLLEGDICRRELLVEIEGWRHP